MSEGKTVSAMADYFHIKNMDAAVLQSFQQRTPIWIGEAVQKMDTGCNGLSTVNYVSSVSSVNLRPSYAYHIPVLPGLRLRARPVRVSQDTVADADIILRKPPFLHQFLSFFGQKHFLRTVDPAGIHSQ